MNQSTKPGGHGLPIEILKWGLLAYTGYRTYDILMMTSGGANLLFVIVGLLGLDFGVLIWVHLYEKKAEGNQATLAALLTAIDILGVGLAMFADMLTHSKQAAEYATFISTVSVWVIGAVIFLNAVGGLIYAMLSPAAERARQEKAMGAAYELKKREAEYDLQLAQLDLVNARTQSQARNLRLQATDTLFMPPTPPQPVIQMAKDAGGPLGNIPTTEEINRVLEWMKTNGGDTPK